MTVYRSCWRDIGSCKQQHPHHGLFVKPKSRWQKKKAIDRLGCGACRDWSFLSSTCRLRFFLQGVHYEMSIRHTSAAQNPWMAWMILDVWLRLDALRFISFGVAGAAKRTAMKGNRWLNSLIFMESSWDIHGSWDIHKIFMERHGICTISSRTKRIEHRFLLNDQRHVFEGSPYEAA